MKKILLTIALAAVAAVSASAQLSVGAGYSMNNATAVSDDSSTEGQTAGFYVEGTINIPVTGALSLAPSLRYTFHSAKDASSAALASLASTTIEGTTTEHYVTVPVMARYNLDLGGAKVFVFAGPTFDFGLSSELKIDSTTSGSVLDAIGLSGSSTRTVDQYGEDSNYKNFDILVGGGLGIQIGHIQAKAGYHYGLMDRDGSDKVKLSDARIEAGLAFVF